MCVNNLPNIALDIAATGIEPVIFIQKPNALTAVPPSHSLQN